MTKPYTVRSRYPDNETPNLVFRYPDKFYQEYRGPRPENQGHSGICPYIETYQRGLVIRTNSG